MTARLYNRGSRILIEKPTGFFSQIGRLELTDMRVAFKIEKQLEKEPNTSQIIVSNLSQNTRAELQKKPLHVRLEVGYDGERELLFTGDVRYTASKRENTEWNTEIHLGDGERAFRHARVNRSYNGGLKRSQAIKEIAREMNLPLAQNIDALIGDSEFVSGVTLSGPANRELTRVLQPLKLNWSIQDGRLQILGKNQHSNRQAIVVSQDTGMIGSPEFGAPENKGEKPLLTVSMLLYPGLTPGGRIQVESRHVNGLFKIQKVTHSGDTHGEEWKSEIEAKEISR